MDEFLKSNTFATHAVVAVGSVALGTALSYPLDTLKVLLQKIVLPQILSLSSPLAKAPKFYRYSSPVRVTWVQFLPHVDGLMFMGEVEEDLTLSGVSVKGAMEDDDLLDLNKEPIEKKRKRAENNSPGNEKEGSLDGLNRVTVRVGRVLRSTTMALNNAEKQVIETEAVVDLADDPVLPIRKKLKGRRGRPPKIKVDNEVCGSNIEEKDDEVMERNNVEESGKGTGQCMKKVKGKRGRPPKIEKISGAIVKKKKTKGRRGRPPKMKNGIAEILVEEKKTKRRGRPRKVENGISKVAFKDKKSKARLGRPPKIDKSIACGTRAKAGTDGGEKSLRSNPNYLGTNVKRGESEKIESAEGKEMGRREQQQLVRDQIVALLKKAGWTIEYRPRQSKDYNDPVYVGRDGRAYWSCTLAYIVLKKRIEDGKADDKELSAFSPIPEELLSTLFRVRKDEGKKKGKGTGKNGKGIPKRALSKIKTSGKRIKSNSSKGRIRTLLARKPGEGSDDYELYDGKRTLLAWMIDLGTVPPEGKVKYKRGRNKKVMLEGKITRDGICCSCCDKVHTIRDFESHAKSGPQESYKCIYLESGNSLLQCLIDSWNKQLATDHIGFISVDVEVDDPNDDTCNICGDGGNLICCDGCPSTFHQGCLCIEKVPSGDWYCAYCSCKYCGASVGNAYTTDDNGDSIVSELLMCRLCEEKFHVPCIGGNDIVLNNNNNPSFCGRECQKIFERLRELLGIRQELEEEYYYTILQRRDISRDASVSGDILEVESNSKLAVAYSVMNECFLPIIDERSKTNVIHNVVYSCGSNFRRLNFGGFYTIILEKDDELVAAASIRIHGSQLAEMPFIGTRYTYRRQGLCRRLLTAIQMVLRDLNVEKMVIPAISELNETWTKKFHFMPLEESKRREMRSTSMVVFPGTDMLQKPLLKHQIAEGQRGTTDKELTEAPTEHQNMQEEHNDDIGGVAAPDVPVPSEVKIQVLASAVHISSEIQDLNEPAAVEFCASVPDCSNDASNIKIGTVKESFSRENGKCLDRVTKTNDDKSLTNSETPAGDARELETDISVEEIISCSNGIIPDGKLVKCN
ncbi:unnamed protein product [Fraxinus pennsylvanica]|uniref:PHD-type domain-containing protein n=1 Tax=Fraxinus pennsylvanica TaxID=56036 RepID=A0AAD2AG35_9LAMI|nr:unnamed protein product [Fraxinus pennsylvanica]